MSCGRGCGGGEAPRNPSYIPNDPARRPRPRQARPPAQNLQTGIGPGAPNWRPPPVGSPPSSPRSPIAASSPVHQVSPERPGRPVYVPQGGGPCQRPPGMDQTFNMSGRAPPQAQNQTYNVPGRAPPQAHNQTYNVPGRAPPQASPPRGSGSSPCDGARPADNAGARGQPALNETYNRSHQRPAMNETYDVYDMDDSDPFADALMDDFGDGDDWDVVPVIPIEDLPEDDDDGEDSEPEPAFDDEQCQPCSGDSSDYIRNTSPPTFEDISGGNEDSSLGVLPENVNDSLSQSHMYEMAEAPSNISVYDAELLNITTAPRNSDLDIPRNRIWMNMINSLNEIDNAEDEEYDNFVAGIQQQRREWVESSR